MNPGAGITRDRLSHRIEQVPQTRLRDFDKWRMKKAIVALARQVL
jgi:hypothetical protein